MGSGVSRSASLDSDDVLRRLRLEFGVGPGFPSEATGVFQDVLAVWSRGVSRVMERREAEERGDSEASGVVQPSEASSARSTRPRSRRREFQSGSVLVKSPDQTARRYICSHSQRTTDGKGISLAARCPESRTLSGLGLISAFLEISVGARWHKTAEAISGCVEGCSRVERPEGGL